MESKSSHMKKILLLISCAFLSNFSNAQHSTDNWFFGVNAALHFPGPTVITGSGLVTTEGCASISNSTGGILFYTDGISVWNRNNVVMPNGTGLMGGTSSTQSALIVPKPGSINLYYIFTVDEDGGPDGFRYSIVDMTLDGGNGDVLTPNVPVLNNVTEKLTAVQKINSSDYWILVHEWGSDAFYAYTLDASGLQSTPVISYTGSVHTNSQIQNTYGQMKFNTCGTAIALAIGYLNTIELFDFDQTTGIVSNPMTIPMTDHVYGIEFAPGNELLYAGCYDPSSTLVQFDLSSHNATTISNSRVTLSSTPDIYGIQLANDGAIYVSRSWSSYLGRIENPDVPGTGCNYNDNGVFLDPNSVGVTSGLGLPGFIQSSFKSPEQNCLLNTISDHNFETLSIKPNPSYSGFTIHPDKATSIQVYDNLGKEIMNVSIDENEFTFGNELTSGIYFMRVDGSGIYKLIKF